MSEDSRPKEKSFTKSTPDTATTLKRMQYQLDAIERKVDSLLKQSGPKDFKSTYSPKPHRGFDSSKRTFNPKYAKQKEGARSEGKFYYGFPTGVKKSPGKSSYRNKKKA